MEITKTKTIKVKGMISKTTTQAHLDFINSITPTSLIKFQREAMINYASSRGVKLNIDGFGNYVVEGRDGTLHKTNNELNAISVFKELVFTNPK